MSNGDVTLLDRPIWSALTTSHKHLAEGGPQALRYPVDVTPFADMVDMSEASFAALRDLLLGSQVAALFTPEAVDVPAGFKVGDTTYTKGELRKFSFSKTPLNVYEDKVVIRMALTALADAPLGAQHIPLRLRFQACSTEACLPPVTLPVDATINLAANSEASRPSHPELFPPQH